MAIETKLGKVIRLKIPFKYYRALERLRDCADNNRSWSGKYGERVVGPIKGTSYIYDSFRGIMENLANWLLDATKDFGYRRGAFIVIGWDANEVTLQETDCPFDAFWSHNVINHISDHYNFGGLLDQWQNDP